MVDVTPDDLSDAPVGLTAVFSEAGGGKSTLLVKYGLQAIKNKDVVFYNLEGISIDLEMFSVVGGGAFSIEGLTTIPAIRKAIEANRNPNTVYLIDSIDMIAPKPKERRTLLGNMATLHRSAEDRGIKVVCTMQLARDGHIPNKMRGMPFNWMILGNETP